MKRRVARLAVVLSPLLAMAAVALGACGRERALAAAGEDCDLAIDCLPGLVCVEQRGGRRVCSNDLSGVVGNVPPDGAAPSRDGGERDGGEGAVSEGGQPDGSPLTPDAGTPDTGSPSPADAATDA